jgi:deoxyribodipyrimidine photolyase-like uncharacterized protein
MSIGILFPYQLFEQNVPAEKCDTIYFWQSRSILLENNQKPIGGKWTYDDENRLKYQKGTFE